jgi:hypothetical protein
MLPVSIPYCSAFSTNYNQAMISMLIMWRRQSFSYKLYNGPAVVDGDGELELWAKAVVDIDDLDTNGVAYAATPSLLRRKSAKHPPTAMHVEVHGHTSSLPWRVDSHLHTACGIGDWNFDIFYSVDLWTFYVK